MNNKQLLWPQSKYKTKETHKKLRWRIHSNLVILNQKIIKAKADMRLLLQTWPLQVQQLSYISEIPGNSSSISRQFITCLKTSVLAFKSVLLFTIFFQIILYWTVTSILHWWKCTVPASSPEQAVPWDISFGSSHTQERFLPSRRGSAGHLLLPSISFGKQQFPEGTDLSLFCRSSTAHNAPHQLLRIEDLNHNFCL